MDVDGRVVEAREVATDTDSELAPGLRDGTAGPTREGGASSGWKGSVGAVEDGVGNVWLTDEMAVSKDSRRSSSLDSSESRPRVREPRCWNWRFLFCVTSLYALSSSIEKLLCCACCVSGTCSAWLVTVDGVAPAAPARTPGAPGAAPPREPARPPGVPRFFRVLMKPPLRVLVSELVRAPVRVPVSAPVRELVRPVREGPVGWTEGSDRGVGSAQGADPGPDPGASEAEDSSMGCVVESYRDGKHRALTTRDGHLACSSARETELEGQEGAVHSVHYLHRETSATVVYGLFRMIAFCLISMKLLRLYSSVFKGGAPCIRF